MQWKYNVQILYVWTFYWQVHLERVDTVKCCKISSGPFCLYILYFKNPLSKERLFLSSLLFWKTEYSWFYLYCVYMCIDVLKFWITFISELLICSFNNFIIFVCKMCRTTTVQEIKLFINMSSWLEKLFTWTLIVLIFEILIWIVQRKNKGVYILSFWTRIKVCNQN